MVLLASIVLVDLLDIEQLTKAYGLVILFEGWPPLSALQLPVYTGGDIRQLYPRRIYKLNYISVNTV